MEESERIKQAVTGTASAIQKEITGTGGEQPTEGRADRALVERIIEHWAAVPQDERLHHFLQAAQRDEVARLAQADEAHSDNIPHDLP
jgi:hypothetical protein